MTNKTTPKSDIDQLTASISIPTNEVDEMYVEETNRVLLNTVLGMFNLKGIGDFLEIHKKVNEEQKRKKLEILITQYVRQTNRQESQIKALYQFMNDPYGNTLFTTILKLVDESSPELEFISILASILKTTVNSNFQALFEQHKYILGIIDTLSVAALLILADHANWPEFQITNYSSEKGIIQSNSWIEAFSREYSSFKGVTDESIMLRIKHAISELQRNELIHGWLLHDHSTRDQGSIREANQTARCQLTLIGKEIAHYLRN